MVHCYLSKGHVYVVGHPTISSTGYYLANDRFYGREGDTGFYLDSRVREKDRGLRHIFGPSGYTECYIDGENIYGRLENLPWMK